MVSVAKASGATAQFTYDNNGNLISGDGRRIDFDLMDRPVRVCSGTSAECEPSAPLPGATSEFAYAPDGARYRQVVFGAVEPSFGPKTVYYVDMDYELTVWPANGPARPAPVLEERSYLGGSVVIFRRGETLREARYLHKDRLGSLDAVTDAGGNELMVDAHGFDPWGKPRKREWTSSGERLHPFDGGVTTKRGFTGHEHLDAHYLIHMNGRVYDYRLGRFPSVDPIISDPTNPQTVNPYSYIGNNPLSGVDPTGYMAERVKETGSNIPKPTIETTAKAIDAGRRSGQFTASTSVEAVAKNVGAPVSMVKDALKAHAGTFKADFGISNGGGDNQGAGVNNTNTTVEGSPAVVAQDKGLIRKGWDWVFKKFNDAIRDNVGPIADMMQPREHDAEVQAERAARNEETLRFGAEQAARDFTGLTETVIALTTMRGAAGGGAKALRATYVSTAEELGALAGRLRAGGMSAEEVVRTISPLRNELKLNIREQGSWVLSKAADLRNLLMYGNRAGPSPDYLFRQYGSWEKALEAISRTNPTVNRLTGVVP